MAVSQGWSEWVAGWFDAIGKILPNIVGNPGMSVTYRTEVKILPLGAYDAVWVDGGGIITQKFLRRFRIPANLPAEFIKPSPSALPLPYHRRGPVSTFGGCRPSRPIPIADQWAQGDSPRKRYQT